MYLKDPIITVDMEKTGIALSALKLLVAKTDVVIIDISPEGEKTATALKDEFGQQSILFIKCDVSNEVELKEAFKSAVIWCGGQINLLVNNAGLVDEINWKHMLSVNIYGVVLGTQLAIEHMSKNKGGLGGVIINTASMVGLIPRYPFPVYTGTKHAIVGFTKSWAENPHIDDMGLRFGCLCPTAVDTAFLKCRADQLLFPDEFVEMLKTLPLLPVSKTVEAFLELVWSGI